MMVNYVCKFAYLGTAYKGWQIQPQGVNTIERNVKKVLSSIFGVPVKINVCSRTDAGVHALELIGSFQAPGSVTLYRLYRGLNALLDHDISVVDLVQTPHLVNVRKENQGKRYIYYIHNIPIDFALCSATSWWVCTPLDLESMRRAACDLVGKFNFSAFRGRGCTSLSPDKTITKIEIKQRPHRFGGEQLEIIVEGESFFKNMVRIIVGTLVDIGKGKLKESSIKQALLSGKRKDAGFTAPPQGLFLDKVFFRENLFINGILALNSRRKNGLN